MSRKQDMKELRKFFRDSVLKRDGYKCVFCARADNLDPHHISPRSQMPNDGYATSNGITLCPDCHIEAEKYFMVKKYGLKIDPKFAPCLLYQKISSSYEKAVNDCEKLMGEQI